MLKYLSPLALCFCTVALSDEDIKQSFEPSTLMPFWTTVACVKDTLSTFVGTDPANILDEGELFVAVYETSQTYIDYRVGVANRHKDQVLIVDIEHSLSQKSSHVEATDYFSFTDISTLNLDPKSAIYDGIQGILTFIFDEIHQIPEIGYDSKEVVKELDHELRTCAVLSLS